MVNNQITSSIASFLFNQGKQLNNALKAYFRETPEDMTLPAIFYPNPIVISSKDTTSTYRLDLSWYVKVFADNEDDAYEIATSIQNAVCRNRFSIPIMSEDGTPTGNYVKVTGFQINRIDSITYQISFSWIERYFYTDVFDESTSVSEVKIDLLSNGNVQVVVIDDNGNVLTDDQDNIIIC